MYDQGSFLGSFQGQLFQKGHAGAVYPGQAGEVDIEAVFTLQCGFQLGMEGGNIRRHQRAFDAQQSIVETEFKHISNRAKCAKTNPNRKRSNPDEPAHPCAHKRR